MQVLWVENHAVFARLAGRQFLSGHSITVVPSLAEARQALGGQDFDVVLLDYDLDDGKGVSLVPFVRQRPGRPVVIAASAHEAGNEALLQAGADAVCAKARFAMIEAVIAEAVQAVGNQRTAQG
jgi:CheY-like chemotaxis protein